MDDKIATAENIHEQLIQAYVECLKTAYSQLRKRWRPDYRGVGDATDHRFRAIAEILASKSMDPYAYVQYVFEHITPTHPDVHVNQVTSVMLATKYLEYRPIQEAKIRRGVYLNADKLKTRIGEGYTLEQALSDPYNHFTPVFAYAMACSKNDKELAAKFKDDAIEMLQFEPLYTELLGKWLPVEGLS